jgi:hypothetical protein
MDRITGFGRKLEAMAANIFDGAASGEGEELIVGEDPLAMPMPRGESFELSFMHYKEPHMHITAYFFTTQLGSPFPSYHSNPLPKFPARWTSIRGVKPPCESLAAPRIRLAPQELGPKVNVLEKMIEAGRTEGNQPMPAILNLSHQALGDPYQFTALRAFLSINKHVEVLNLNDNELDDIVELELGNVRVLHVSSNNFVSFDALPPLPRCHTLHLKNNFLSGFSGLSKSKFPSLLHISVDLNPIQHRENLVKTLKETIPTLATIDGVRV